MTDGNGEAILTATCFRLGMLGARITQAFSERIERVGVTHKQVGLLAVVGSGLAQSQRDIAAHLKVAPSLVVSLVDQLIALDAVSRARSTVDRRVQLIQLTERGRELLIASENAAAEIDIEFRNSLSVAGRSALDELLLDLEAQHPTVINEP